ncbi:ComEC/Rec2 family competence protein [Nocardia sp. NBC_01009]|uniref:ComEC/Rec2 family competence protein n=1 Tax=Nocardia sp. NBC_01009 TaxID=2975996 RepID=UPI00386CFFBA|nr:ComEC/Rec2 family competence protein [Nocardia sp. NBC_01009]
MSSGPGVDRRPSDSDNRDEDRDDEPQVLDARLLPATLCCWSATIVAVTSGWVVGLVVAAGLSVLAIGLWVLLLWAVAHRSERWRVVAVVALAAVLLGVGFAIAGAWREHRVATHPLRTAIGASVRVVATPIDDPKPVRTNSFAGERRWTVRAELREYRQGEVTVRTGGVVVILASGVEWAQLLPGGPVEFRAQIDQPWHQDLSVVTLRALDRPVVVGRLPWWQRVAAAVRTDFAASASRALPADPAGLLPALVVGDTSALPDDVREEFKIAGLQHLCVVSGANFTILLSVVLLVVRALTLGPRLAAMVAAAALLMFIVLARPDPSVLRAGAMGAITLLALVTGRRKQALPALCAAVLGLLAIWPELAVRAGFALSVVATAGLILLAPSWADWLRARGWWRMPAEIVAVSAGAFVVTTPLMVALTGQLSLVAVLANVLVAPVVAPITVIGATGAVLSCIWQLPAELVLRCAGPPMWWLLTIAEHAAGIPGATIDLPGGLYGGSITAAVVAVFVWSLRSAIVRRLTAATFLGIAAVLFPLRIWHPWWPPSGWVLAACDVGQGDGLVLSIGDGAAIVIDVGPEPRAIRTCLDRLHITRIPLLVLTHPHADHIGGLTGALEGRSVAALAVGPGELPAVPGLRHIAASVNGGTGDDTASSAPAANSHVTPGDLCSSIGDSRAATDGPGASPGDRCAPIGDQCGMTGGCPHAAVGDPCTVTGDPPPRTAGSCAMTGDPSVTTSGPRASSGDPRGSTSKPRAPTSHARAATNGPVQVATAAARAGVPVVELSAGYVMSFGAVELMVLAPTASLRPSAGSAAADDANDRSVVIAATTPAGRILLTGDIEAPAQHRLLNSGAPVQADILKVPHHGSRTTAAEFLAAVHPRLAIVSVGADNPFGHPHPGLLADLARAGSGVIRTDQLGDVVITGAGSKMQVVTLR